MVVVRQVQDYTAITRDVTPKLFAKLREVIGHGHEPARKLMDLLEVNTTVFCVDKSLLGDAMTLLRRYWSPRKKLSVCDATSYELMQNREIEQLYSFDSGFDGLPGITRIC